MEPNANHHVNHRSTSALPPSDPAHWDERYASADQLWSGEPNSVLVEVADSLRPGRALDVGCGEGADAVWLAMQGWTVTGIDISTVAVQRAEQHGRNAGVSVTWLRCGLVDAGLEPGSFDLVSAQYPVLPKTADSATQHELLGLVAPGGTLAIVHHADFEAVDASHDGFDSADYVGPWDLAPLLANGWQIDLDERRPRHLATGAGAHHSEDVILVARRV